MKTGPGETIPVVQSRAAQIIRAFGIDKKFHAIALDDFVAGLPGAKRHFVLQTRATAFGNTDAQPLLLGRFARFEEASQLPDRIIRHCNHPLGESIPRVGVVKPAAFSFAIENQPSKIGMS